MKQCPTCNAQNPDNYSFCRQCGAALTQNAVSTSAPSNTVNDNTVMFGVLSIIGGLFMGLAGLILGLVGLSKNKKIKMVTGQNGKGYVALIVGVVIAILNMVVGLIMAALITLGVIANIGSQSNDRKVGYDYDQSMSMDNETATETVHLTWEAAPVAVEPGNIEMTITEPEWGCYYESTEVDYEKIGTLSNNQELVRAFSQCDQSIYYFAMDGQNNVAYLIANLGDGRRESEVVYVGNSAINLDIPELNPTEIINYDGTDFFPAFPANLGHSETGLFDEATEMARSDIRLTKLQTVTNGDFYRQDGMHRSFFLVTPDKMAHPYYLPGNDVFGDDGSMKVVWSDGVIRQNESWQLLNREGCSAQFVGSGVNTSIIDAPNQNDLVQVGELQEIDVPVYKLIGGESLQTLYDRYTSEREGYTEPVLSLEEYVNYPAVLVWQDEIGEWNAILNSQFGELAECGKPVVYLYPETETLVDVKVGAQVTVSEPTYPQDTGWEKVLAKPNGELTYQNEKYDSLFWEGLGDGAYPDVGNIGFVVAQKDLLPTVEKQLAEQGLNEKEIADFMEFWSEHLPATPYVKLTWLTTAEMNELAPLEISPRPQTVIRVFLDARGLEEPVQLREQKLTAPAREGFTVVEWGGLLMK